MSARWAWHYSPATKKRQRDDEFASQAFVLALLIGGVAVVFWQQLVGAAVFIGESDRLNTYLNMRLAEHDALRSYGRVPAWNPTMFGGFSVAALHWMNPATDPIAFFLQLFPRDQVYQALGYVSIALVLAACATAYFYIRDLTGTRIPAAIAALCYGLSAFGVHRIAQVDNAYLTLVLLPAGMLAIRRIRAGNLIGPFVGLTLSISALAFWGFLQEVAYAFCFLAAYALYRAAVSWKFGARAALGVLIVVGASFVVCLLFAAPRLITVGSEFFRLSRPPGHFHHPGYQEFLRFFHEGIYGRYFAESRLMFNSLNLHEGLQLVSSTTVALFVCFGVLRPTIRLEFVAGLLLFAMIFAIGPVYLFPPVAFWPSKELINIASFLFLLGFGAAFAKLVPATPRPTDTTFHLTVLIVLLVLILVPEAFYTVYLMFGRSDFSHTRLSILVLLPLCSLFAIYLAELKTLPFGPALPWPTSPRALLTALGIILVAALVSWLIHGPIFDQLVQNTPFRTNPPAVVLPHPPDLIVLPIAIKVVLTAAILALVLAALLRRLGPAFDGRIAATLLVATFAFVETVTYAHFKVDGSQNWTYPVPFGSLSYMDVPPSVMRPPSEEKLEAFTEKVEVENFRSMLVTEQSFYAGPLTPHISQFWRARMVGGYGTGVPERLASLPWPESVSTLRAIELRWMTAINPYLLSLLNVKYLVLVTPGLYFDTASNDSEKLTATLSGAAHPTEIVDIDGISFGLITNPVAPLQRHFMVERVTGVQEIPRLQGDALEARAHPAAQTQDGAATSALVRERVGGLTQHSLAEEFSGTETFDATGSFDVTYQGDMIVVGVTPANRERFLVINERYHPNWRARAQAEDIPIYPQACLVCGRKPSDPHHLGFTQPRALGRKVSDEFAVPLCRGHHRAVHRSRDERAWWRQAGIDPIKVARRLWKATRGMGQRRSQRSALPRPHDAAGSSDPTPKNEEINAPRQDARRSPLTGSSRLAGREAAGCSRIGNDDVEI
jgi:hypothetical protein